MAAIAAAYSPHVIEATELLPAGPLFGFWNHTRQRLHGWLRQMHESEVELCSGQALKRRVCWNRLEGTLAEILSAELLTRVWCGVLTAYDLRHESSYAGPIARGVLLGQAKARRDALRLLAECPAELRERAGRLDQWRRKVERWTDVLLGNLVVQYSLSELAFVEERAREFGLVLSVQGSGDPRQSVWGFVVAGLRLAFTAQGSCAWEPSADDAPILRAVLATFPADAFTAEGVIKTILHGRISRSGWHPDECPSERSWCVAGPAASPPDASAEQAKLREQMSLMQSWHRFRRKG